MWQQTRGTNSTTPKGRQHGKRISSGRSRSRWAHMRASLHRKRAGGQPDSDSVDADVDSKPGDMLTMGGVIGNTARWSSAVSAHPTSAEFAYAAGATVRTACALCSHCIVAKAVPFLAVLRWWCTTRRPTGRPCCCRRRPASRWATPLPLLPSCCCWHHLPAVLLENADQKRGEPLEVQQMTCLGNG